MKGYTVDPGVRAMMESHARAVQYEIAKRANQALGCQPPRIRGAMDFLGGVCVRNKDIIIHEEVVKDVENRLPEQTEEEEAVARAIEDLANELHDNPDYLNTVAPDIHGDPLRAMFGKL